MCNFIKRTALLVPAAAILLFTLGASKQEQDFGILLVLYAVAPIFDFFGGLGLHLVFSGMFPDFHARHRSGVKKSWVPSLLVGIGTVVILLVLLLTLGQRHPALGVCIMIFIVFLLGLGLQGPAANLGDRIYRDKADASDMSRARAGWFAYAFVQYVPIMGFVFTTLVAITGLGAFILCLFTKSARSPEPAKPVDEEKKTVPTE